MLFRPGTKNAGHICIIRERVGQSAGTLGLLGLLVSKEATTEYMSKSIRTEARLKASWSLTHTHTHTPHSCGRYHSILSQS